MADPDPVFWGVGVKDVGGGGQTYHGKNFLNG